MSFRDNEMLNELIKPFKFDEDSIVSPTEFNINFIQDGIRYEYGFSVDSKQIRAEWLYAYPNKKGQLLFTREWLVDHYEYKFGNNYKGDKKRFEDITKSTALFLSVALSFESQYTATQIEKWLINFNIDNLHTFGNAFAMTNGAIQRFGLGLVDYEEVTSFLTIADLSIDGFELRENNSQIDNDTYVGIITKHNINNKIYELKFTEKSSGTRQIFNFASKVILTLKAGGMLIIDELNNFLHPLLV